MKFNFENLIPNEKVIKIFESLEELGYDIMCRDGIQCQWDDTEDFMLFEAKISNSNTNTFSIIKFPKKCFKKKEPLKPYIWYPAEEFDGNPADYYVVESSCSAGYIRQYVNVHELSPKTTYFMYIERIRNR